MSQFLRRAERVHSTLIIIAIVRGWGCFFAERELRGLATPRGHYSSDRMLRLMIFRETIEATCLKRNAKCDWCRVEGLISSILQLLIL